MLTAKHLPDFARFDFCSEFVETAVQIGGDIFPLLRPFHQDGEIAGTGAQRLGKVGVFLQPPATLQDLLRCRLVVPEIGCARLSLEYRDFIRNAGRVKDNSGGQPPA